MYGVSQADHKNEIVSPGIVDEVNPSLKNNAVIVWKTYFC